MKALRDLERPLDYWRHFGGRGIGADSRELVAAGLVWAWIIFWSHNGGEMQLLKTKQEVREAVRAARYRG